MLTDRIWWGQRGKYLAQGHEERTSLRSYHSINKYTVFRFRTSHFYHSWCYWTWEMKSVILFSTGNVRLQCLPLWKVWFLSQDRPQYNLSLFFLTLSYLCVIMDSLSSGTFHFLAGVICMIEAKTIKKTKWRHTFVTSDGCKIIEIVRTLS